MTPIPPYPQPVPYTRESVTEAWWRNGTERIKAALEMGLSPAQAKAFEQSGVIVEKDS